MDLTADIDIAFDLLGGVVNTRDVPLFADFLDLKNIGAKEAFFHPEGAKAYDFVFEALGHFDLNCNQGPFGPPY